MGNFNFVFNTNLSSSEIVIVLTVGCAILVAVILVCAVLWLLNYGKKVKGRPISVPETTTQVK